MQQAAAIARRCLITAGQLAAGQPSQRRQIKLLQRQPMRSRLRATQPVSTGEELQVLSNGKLTVERELLSHIADSLAS